MSCEYSKPLVLNAPDAKTLSLHPFRWRRFENGRREIDSENFIDGDLLESFLDLTKEQQQAVVDGRPLLPKAKPMKKIDITVEELSRMMEELSRIH